MKILFLQDDFPPYSYGGAGQVAFNLAKGLKEKGHQVFVISAKQEKSLSGRENYQGLGVYRIYSNYHERWRAYLGLYHPGVVSQIKKIIKEVKPDIIHAHNIHYHLSYYSLKIAKRFGCPLFLTLHDAMSFHYAKLTEFISPNNLSIPKKINYQISPLGQIKRFKKRYNPFRNIIIRHYLKCPNQIFAVSQALKKALNDNKIKNVEVVYNGIDLKNWSLSLEKVNQFKNKHHLTDKKVIFLASRLTKAKGIEALLDAFVLVNQKIKNSILFIAAKKDNYLKKIIEIAQEMGIGDNLVVAGWLDQENLKKSYLAADLVVTPSLCLDTFNLSNIEAMAARKPVVGTCFGGTPEIVTDGQTGYIVNPLNKEMMAEKIIGLLANSQKSEEFGRKGYQRVKENFSLEKQIDQILNYYHKFRPLGQ